MHFIARQWIWVEGTGRPVGSEGRDGRLCRSGSDWVCCWSRCDAQDALSKRLSLQRNPDIFNAIHAVRVSGRRHRALVRVRPCGTGHTRVPDKFTVRTCVRSHVQQFTALTKHKPEGRRWVTKEQYIRYFSLCYDVLYPGHGLSLDERRVSLTVRGVACWRSESAKGGSC